MIAFIKRLFANKPRNYILGRKAEDFAIKYIKKNTSYKYLTKNYRYKNFEVDILAYDKERNFLVIIEVKARSENALVNGYFSALEKSKIDSVIACKNEFLKRSRHNFDGFSYNIFEIIHNEKGKIIEHYFHEDIPLKRKNLKRWSKI